VTHLILEVGRKSRLTSFAGGVGCVVSDRRAVMTNTSAASALDFVDAPASHQSRLALVIGLALGGLPSRRSNRKGTNYSTPLIANSLQQCRR
jgi:hypothetical protein